jgi:signal transduction histidine kinase
MNAKASRLSRQYHAALQKHLKRGRSVTLRPAQSLGRLAITNGLEMLDLAKIHEQALITLVVPNSAKGAAGRSRAEASGTREAMVRRAGAFFAEAILPIEKTHRIAQETNVHLSYLSHRLRQRSVELTASNRQLKQEIAQRKSAEESLRKSEQHYDTLLEQSQRMQEQLRFLSRQLLSAQEEERKKISRELHDVIAQTLTSINVRLGTLKKEAALSTRGLARSIARTQLLVEQSVDIVHRFARELRPTVLDDLGLIPALHTFMKSFRAETGIGISLTTFAQVEQVNGDKRTVLYRVAQEALNNIARHAQATRAEVRIQKLDGAICMKISDNGRGFQQGNVLNAKKSTRLGLLGMRERLQMVGGDFTVTSAPGKGTIILAQIPLIDQKGGGSRNRAERVRRDQTLI